MKYRAEFNWLNTIAQVVILAHTRLISFSMQCIDNNIVQFNWSYMCRLTIILRKSSCTI